MERMPSSSCSQVWSSAWAPGVPRARARTAAIPMKFARIVVTSRVGSIDLVVVLFALPAIEVRVDDVADVPHAAGEGRGIVLAAAARIEGVLRVGTTRPRPIHPAVRRPVRSDDAVRSDALLDPPHERTERVEARRACAAAAMKHSRDHEEAVEIVDTGFRVAVLLVEIARDRAMELDREHWDEPGIGPPVIHDDFVARCRIR